MANWTNPEYLADLYDELWELFANTSTWLKGQYLCRRILANASLITDDDLVRIAMHLSLGQWTEGAPDSNPWPCRQEEEYLMHWQPVMAFGTAEQAVKHQLDRIASKGVSEVLCGVLKSDRVDEVRRQMAEATPERIAEIKRNLVA